MNTIFSCGAKPKGFAQRDKVTDEITTHLFLRELHMWLVEFHVQKSLCSRKPFKPPNKYMQLW